MGKLECVDDGFLRGKGVTSVCSGSATLGLTANEIEAPYPEFSK